ncbi:MAG: CpsD/CapB family tyrosine-protein kinase [Nitrosomonadales bacterium]|nr:CpsD/CapB family tyrosine-protein kinase [Nitrosomonadales bacterium]
MERIKQAIEKAKKPSPGETTGTFKLQAGRLLVDGEGAAPRTADEPVEVSYKRTRVVRLRAETLEKNRIFAFNKNDPTSLIFDVLRTQILQKMEANGWRTLAITSPTPAAGKTVVAINLAMSIAQKTDRTAMLVDFDLRQPRVGAYLGIPLDKSLNDLLDGQVELADVLVNPDIPRLVVLPTRDAVRHPSETLSSGAISALIKELREHYESRITIFDLPSLLHSDDAIAVIPQIDCILMVIANGMSTKREIDDAIRHLSKANLLGTVFNKA